MALSILNAEEWLVTNTSTVYCAIRCTFRGMQSCGLISCSEGNVVEATKAEPLNVAHSSGFYKQC